DRDILHASVVQDGSEDNLLIKIPGCKKADLDSHVECSIATTSYYTYCSDNRLSKLIKLGENIDEHSPSAFPGKIGVEIFSGVPENYTISEPSSQWRDAGVVANRSFPMFKITEVTDSAIAIKYGVAVGDEVISIDGRTAKDVHQLECLLGDYAQDDDVHKTKIYVWRESANKLIKFIIERTE
ncbi:MAG TPA: hypothetical protein VMI72_11320, partial [Roseiarcus sp.]|nr:hypothetical protein [Roseiarcus sp.]